MNKILITTLLFMFFLAGDIQIDNYSLTGHDEFSNLEFVDSHCTLMKDMDDLYVKMRIKGLSTKFIGTSTSIEYEYKEATYVGNVIFSRSNKTRDIFIFDYSLQTVEFMSRCITIKGSLNMKAAGKIKKVEASGGIQIDGSYEVESSSQQTEKSSMTIKVYPQKKMTLRVTGDARISSGFTKKWLFWICIQQGAWEIVDIVTSYFELVEEDA
ncbi:MAG: hypothetical protein PHY42_04875 [Bacilli bacterium]|nr:hypothetical protein [Bacilli bacterium]